MKLILAIVHQDDTEETMLALRQKGLRCTKISSTGGFLRKGNVTLMIGAEDARVDDAVAVLREHGHAHAEASVPVGGATIFVFDVERYERF